MARSFASLPRDCCDREAMGHVATTGSIIAQNIRDLMAATVKHQFSPVNRLAAPIERLNWLGTTAAPTLLAAPAALPVMPHLYRAHEALRYR